MITSKPQPWRVATDEEVSAMRRITASAKTVLEEKLALVAEDLWVSSSGQVAWKKWDLTYLHAFALDHLLLPREAENNQLVAALRERTGGVVAYVPQPIVSPEPAPAAPQAGTQFTLF
jgi:hypothetical protein